MEALYTQHHDGNDAFRYEMSQDQAAARMQDQRDYLRPIVDRHYADPLDMFDAVTHEKGAVVLDMLRYVMDGAADAARPASQRELLFRALHHYLVAHHAHTVVTGDLVDALRASTGLELGWFFHQWVFGAGTPSYRVSAAFDSTRGLETLRVAQVQHGTSVPRVFRMPIAIAFHGADGRAAMTVVWDSLRTQEFSIPLASAPVWVDFDPDDVIEKTVDFPQPFAAIAAKALHDPVMMSRLSAVEQLATLPKGAAGERARVLARVLETDRFYGVRAAAASSLGDVGSAEALAVLRDALKAQPDGRVRARVASVLAGFAKDSAVYLALVSALRQDTDYAVEAAAARSIGRSRNPGAEPVLAAQVRPAADSHLLTAVLSGLAATMDPRAATVLLDETQPGVPDYVRASALEALAAMKDSVPPDDSARVAATARAALDDPALTVRLSGETLVGAFALRQFRAEVARDADAPLVIQSRLAQQVVGELDRLPHQ